MKLELSQRFNFDAAHTLERQYDTASSRRIHGHSYQAEITVCGEPDPASGMVVDLAVLRGVIAQLHEQLDHRFLDEVPGLAPATLENLCRWIAREAQQRLGEPVRVIAVEVARPSSGDRCVLKSAQAH